MRTPEKSKQFLLQIPGLRHPSAYLLHFFAKWLLVTGLNSMEGMHRSKWRAMGQALPHFSHELITLSWQKGCHQKFEVLDPQMVEDFKKFSQPKSSEIWMPQAPAIMKAVFFCCAADWEGDLPISATTSHGVTTNHVHAHGRGMHEF